MSHVFQFFFSLIIHIVKVFPHVLFIIGELKFVITLKCAGLPSVFSVNVLFVVGAYISNLLEEKKNYSQ
jgi:hypothetical protein